MAIFLSCSQGFWGANPGAWEPTGFTPETPFVDVFDRVVNNDPTLTLLEALNLTGPGVPVNVNALIREAVAAVLNATHPDLNYPLTEEQVVQEFQNAFDSGDSNIIEAQKDRFEFFNSPVFLCPLPGIPPINIQ